MHRRAAPAGRRPDGDPRGAAHRPRRRAGRRGHAGPARPATTTTPAGSAATTTRSSPTCTTPPPTWSARASRRAARCGAAAASTAPTSPAGSTTACPTGPAASASTTTSRSASSGCSTRAPSGSPTSTSTSTTATGSRRSSGTTRGSLTISLHETGQMLFPGTGFPNDVGGPGAQGSRSTWRCPRAPATRAGCAPSTRWSRRCCASSSREVLVTQHGCDSHLDDPLAHLMLTVDGQRATYVALHDLAHEVARRQVGRHRGRRVRRGRGRAAGVDPPAGDRGRARRSTRAPRPPPAGASTSDPAGPHRPLRLTDGRTPGLPRLVGGLRPGHLAGPRDPRDAVRGLPLARPRSAALSVKDSARRCKRTRRIT